MLKTNFLKRLKRFVASADMRTAILVAKIDKQKAAIASQRTRIDKLKVAIASQRTRIDKLKVAIASRRTRIDKQKAAIASQRTRIDKLKVAIASRRTRIEKLSNSIELKSELFRHASRYLPVYRQGLLFDELTKDEIDFSADCYLALLPSSLPAAFQLKKAHGGIVVCDCVENVEVDRHSIAPSYHRPALQLVNQAAYGGLLQADRILTIGKELARTLDRFGRPVMVLPNYRRHEIPVCNGRLRAACGVKDSDVLLYASGNVVIGFEPILRALVRLPAHVHLAAMIRLKPSSYEAEMRILISDLGLEKRVHFFDFVPYVDLAATAAGADVGLIISDVANPNGAVCLPNRFFDYLTSGLPVIAPPMPDVVDLLSQYGFGISLPEVTEEAWLSALNRLLSALPEYKERTVKARDQVFWESNEDALFDFLDRPRRVTMLGFRDLSRYQRFLRIAQGLSARGTQVKAVFISTNPEPIGISNSQFYHFDDIHGRSAGLQQVPESDLKK